MPAINDHIQKELEVQKRFLDSELKNHFEIRPNVKWRTAHHYMEFDIALFKENILYAIVEIKMNSMSIDDQTVRSQVKKWVERTHCRFGIITDNTKFYIIDLADSPAEYKEESFDQLVQHLINPKDILQEDNNAEENIKNALNKCFSEKDIRSIVENIKYDKKQGSFSFIDISKEEDFLQRLIRIPNSGTHVYRYTSLETLFVMLNKGTYRMNCIIGMNDKSEIDYFDKKYSKINPGSLMEELNKIYLSSCSSLKDDLTMWRLYGDDARGVCLDFEIVFPEKRDNNFVLAYVNYAEERGKHNALEMLNQLYYNEKMNFNRIDKWKHFFKPYDYNVEREVRLMFLDDERYNNCVINRDWIRTWSHSIIIPTVDFKLNSPDFPLQLKGITLGSKMPEQELNRFQLENLISSKKYEISIATSEIVHYR